MSGKDQSTCLKPSIQKLRTLREQLCSKQSDWKTAFAVRDYVISELIDLKEMLSDNSVARDECIEKAKSILSNFEDENNTESEK